MGIAAYLSLLSLFDDALLSPPPEDLAFVAEVGRNVRSELSEVMSCSPFRTGLDSTDGRALNLVDLGSILGQVIPLRLGVGH